MMIWFYGHNSASPLIMHFKLYEGKKLFGASSIKTALTHLAHIVQHQNHRHHHSFMKCDLQFFPRHKGDISCIKREFRWSQPKNPSSSFLLLLVVSTFIFILIIHYVSYYYTCGRRSEWSGEDVKKFNIHTRRHSR